MRLARVNAPVSLSLLVVLFSGRALGQTDGVEASPDAGQAAELAVAPVREMPPLSRHARLTYQRYCASCHGVAGDGRGPSAEHLDSIATNFTTGVYKCRSTPATSLPTEADLDRSVRVGLSGTAMPPFNTLGPLEQEDVREALKSFSGRWTREAIQPSLAIPMEPATSEASIAKGHSVYQNLKCATCHGDDGHGAAGGMNLRDDRGNPSRVTDLTSASNLKCGASNAELYRTLMTGLSGTPMSGYAEVVSPEDAWNLVHYLDSLRQ